MSNKIKRGSSALAMEHFKTNIRCPICLTFWNEMDQHTKIQYGDCCYNIQMCGVFSASVAESILVDLHRGRCNAGCNKEEKHIVCQILTKEDYLLERLVGMHKAVLVEKLETISNLSRVNQEQMREIKSLKKDVKYYRQKAKT